MTLWLLPLSTLLGLNATAYPFTGDIGQHIEGQRYFLADSWRWPPLVAKGLGWPDGTNIAFTDSIPLESLLLKLVRHWLPHGFEGVHLWLGLCYLLQPVSAVYALRGTGERRIVPALTVATLALSMPAFWFRFVHAALSSHFLILVALGLYLRLCREPPRTGRLLLAAGLLPMTMLVHPYLLVMVSALLAAAPVSLLARADRRWLAVSGAVGAGIVACAVLGLLLGYGKAIPDQVSARSR